MGLNLRGITLCSSVFLLLFFSLSAFALEFEPGVGVGFEYTDNATLVSDDPVDDVIRVGYLGARLSENEGPLNYDVTASINNSVYADKTFSKQHDQNLAATANWEMVKRRVIWSVSNIFTQHTINSIGSNTPNNLQDTNAFSLSVDLLFPVSARQSFSLTPLFSQYYYEQLLTDNKQVSLSANWHYKMFRLTNVGLSASVREINYKEQLLADTTFTNFSINIDGQRARSSYSASIGATNVERDTSESTSGFSGNLNWLVDLTSRSTFSTTVSSDITDTSTVAATNNPVGNDVQVTADVVRNSVFKAIYQRDDASLHSSIFASYGKVRYSNNPLDQISKSLNLQFSYPVTRLLSSGVYASYNYTKRLDSARVDERNTVGANLDYIFSRKLRGSFDVKFREKESTFEPENYDDISVYVSLVYGFGEVRRPSRAGGF